MQKYALYILYSQSLDIYYKGISHDPELRLQYHNSSSKGWTKRGRPWKLVFNKAFDSKKEAQFWEIKIKKIKKRAIVETIINGQFDWTK